MFMYNISAPHLDYLIVFSVKLLILLRKKQVGLAGWGLVLSVWGFFVFKKGKCALKRHFLEEITCL